MSTSAQPPALYIGVFMALVGLTMLTVGQSYVDLGRLTLAVVIAIATTKAALVVTLRVHDERHEPPR